VPVQPPNIDHWQRLAALDARADLTLHRAEFYPEGHVWKSIADERGTVRGHEPTLRPQRQWIVTVRLRGGQVQDVVQTRGAAFDETALAACEAAEARGWHLKAGQGDRPASIPA
jgi:hypothetical protein